MKTALYALISTILSLALAFAGLEAFVRVALDDGMQYDLEMWKYAMGHKQVSAIDGAGHVHIPNTQGRLMGVDVAINSQGQRGAELPASKQDDVFRILLLGDSITFGWGVAEAETMAGRLRNALKDRFPSRDFEVVNAGVGNTNTAMQVAWYLEQGRRYEPDLVVLNYFINDAEPTPSRHGGLIRETSMAFVYFEGRVDTISRQFMGKVDWEDYYRDLYTDGAAGWGAARQAIDRLVETTRTDGTRLMIANIPEIRRLAPYPFPEVRAAISEIAADHDVAYLDLHASVAAEPPESLWVTVEDPHPNGKANGLFADALVDALEGNGLLRPAAP